MSEEYKDQESEKKVQEYRLVVLRAEDMEEVRSFDLTASKIYVLISSVILLLVFIIVGLIVMTPLQKLIPGYGRIEANGDFIKLVEKVDQFEAAVEAQEVYINALRKLITSDGDSSQSLEFIEVSSKIVDTKTMDTTLLTDIDTTIPKEKAAYRVSYATDDEDLWQFLTFHHPQAPVEGFISAEFDPSRKHYGVDVLAPANTAVRSILDGYVISSGWDLETGYTIGVQHKGEIISFYKHNSILLKEKGTFVSAGEAVAIIGNTGTLSSGPHLHFEFWHQGKPINPKDIINFN